MKKRLNPFLILWFLFMIVGFFVVLLTNKGEIILWVNVHRTPFLSILFKYGTHLGDGLMFLPALIGLLFVNFNDSIKLVSVSLWTLIISQGLKKTIFLGWPRPTAYFTEEIHWQFVEGVKVAVRNTFPSGHSLAAFALFYFISTVINRKAFYILCFLLAILVACSRVYLLQHFFIDVYFGAMLGVLAVVIGDWMHNKIWSDQLRANWSKRSIFTRNKL